MFGSSFDLAHSTVTVSLFLFLWDWFIFFLSNLCCYLFLLTSFSGKSCYMDGSLSCGLWIIFFAMRTRLKFFELDANDRMCFPVEVNCVFSSSWQSLQLLRGSVEEFFCMWDNGFAKRLSSSGMLVFPEVETKMYLGLSDISFKYLEVRAREVAYFLYHWVFCRSTITKIANSSLDGYPVTIVFGWGLFRPSWLLATRLY